MLKRKKKIRKSASANLDELMDTLSLSKMSALKGKEVLNDQLDRTRTPMYR